MADSIGKGFPTTNLQIGHIFCDIDDLTLWKYIGGPTSVVTSWVLIGGQVNVQPDTSLWGANQAGATWFYTPEQTYYGWNGSALVSIALGSGMNLYNFKTTYSMQDDFLTGSTSSGSIGTLSWSSAGTITVRPPTGSEQGRYRLDTGAVSGTQARINFTSSANFPAIVPYDITWIIRFESIDANTTFRIGVANSVAADPPDNGIYFEKLDADTNLFCVVRAATSQSRVDSGYQLTATVAVLKFRKLSDRVLFYINEQLVATILSSTIAAPVGLLSPYTFIINSAAAAKTITVDYFEMTSEVTR